MNVKEKKCKSCRCFSLCVTKYATAKSHRFFLLMICLIIDSYGFLHCVWIICRCRLMFCPVLKLCLADVAQCLCPNPLLPLNSSGCSSVCQTNFKGFQLPCVRVALSFLCVSPSYLHLTVQPRFSLYNIMRTYKGNGASVHRRGALHLQVGVVNAVMGDISVPLSV